VFGIDTKKLCTGVFHCGLNLAGACGLSQDFFVCLLAVSKHHY